MAWKYCNGDFSQRDKGRRPRGSLRTLNVYIYIVYRDTRAIGTRIYADVECRYHRARMSIGITSRGDILLSLCWREFTVLRSSAAARRLKGYKRTDPCVSPLFPLIFLVENPQSVRSAFLFPSVPLTPARTNRIETLAPPEEEEGARHYLTYVVHGKRLRIRREPFSRGSLELLYLHDWRTLRIERDREKESAITLNREWRHGSQSLRPICPDARTY